jgi:site-specific recombinase
MDWVTQARERGYHDTLLSLLDVLEPFAPVVGQWLLVAAPVAGLFGQRQAFQDLSQLLDTPEGVRHLRHLLSDEHYG